LHALTAGLGNGNAQFLAHRLKRGIREIETDGGAARLRAADKEMILPFKILCPGLPKRRQHLVLRRRKPSQTEKMTKLGQRLVAPRALHFDHEP